jgi:hypothetical protein
VLPIALSLAAAGALFLASRTRAVRAAAGAVGEASARGGAAVADGAARVGDFAGDAIEEVTVTVERMADVVTRALMPRGMRNNNPGNLRWIADPARRWRGMIADDGSGYAVFDSLVNGTRAMARQLLAYEARGLRTVRAIVTTWAPPVENETAAYVTAVAAALGVDPAATIDVRARLPALVGAMARHENGRRLDGSDWLTSLDITAGVREALA